MSQTITEFLESRIDEEEAQAEAASVSMHGERHTNEYHYGDYVLGSERDSTVEQDQFILSWWPARVLAECAAKRAIIVECREDHEDSLTRNDDTVELGSVVLYSLAAVYKDHPDYRQEWAA